MWFFVTGSRAWIAIGLKPAHEGSPTTATCRRVATVLNVARARVRANGAKAARASRYSCCRISGRRGGFTWLAHWSAWAWLAEWFVTQPSGKCSKSCNALSRSEEHTSELQSLRHLVCRL